MCGHKGSKAAIESMKESHIRSQSVWKYSIFFNHSHKCTDSPVPLPAPHHKRASWGGSGGALGQKRSNQHLDFYVNLIILWSYKVFVLALHMEMKTSVLPQGSSCVLSSMTGLKQHLCALQESWMPNSFRKQTKKKSHLVILTGPGLITFSVCETVNACQILNWAGKKGLRWRCWHNEANTHIKLNIHSWQRSQRPSDTVSPASLSISPSRQYLLCAV